MIFFKLIQDQVFGLLPKATSIPQTTTYQIRTEHLLPKSDKAQQLYEDDRIKMLLPLLTELRNKNNVLYFIRMRQLVI